GKSTLIKIISGAYTADGGEIFIEGRKARIETPADAKRFNIETIYQDLALMDDLDLAPNIFIGREIVRGGVGRLIKFLNNTKMAEETVRILRKLNIEVPDIKRKVFNLSGGQRQAVAISRAIYFNARLLIMDEPTAALGVEETGKVYSLIRELRQNGIAVIIISHNINEVFDVADKFVVLKTGMLVGVRRKEETSLDEILRMIIAGSTAGAETPASPAARKTNAAPKGKMRSSAQAIQKAAAFLSLVLMIGFFSIGSPFFMAFDNLMTVILQTSVIGILAIGVTFVIIASGIDLSLGAVLAFSGMVIGKAVNAGLPVWLSVICGILVATIMGLLNGVLVAKATLPPFIATLGVMMVARGLTLVVSEARPVYFLVAPSFKLISQGSLFGAVPYPIIYLLILALAASFVMRRLGIGRYIYGLGSNEMAVRLSGVNVDRVKIFTYSVCGLLAGVAGVVLTARLNSAQPAAGMSYELDAIAAAVIGGTSLSGGEGTILGTMIGALIMGVLKNGLNLMNVSQFWQQVAMGIVVIGSVYMDIVRRRRN
ncbi:MAG: ATP-binding cassette domain-containing protein, partial [Spirochaetes bacterium]|nr:ATP-binding cassette domain-containing protein [Spirochaetota bacterium]